MDLAKTISTLHVLGDESRLRLCALLRERELTVTDLVRITGLSQSRVSSHLARLREAGFVRDRRDGQHAFYALSTDALSTAAKAVLDEAMSAGDPTLEGDARRLAELEAERRGSLPETFAGQMDLHYSPGRTWQSLSVGLSALLDLGSVLDVGSGDGAAAALFVRHCRSLTCIDTSTRMVDAARERFCGHPHVTVAAADVHDLPFDEASFDVVLMFHTLTYAERPERAVQECARVLRSGGQLVVLSLDRHEHAEITAPYGERHPGFSPDTIRGWLSAAGLTVTSCDVATRERKRPHFQVVLGTARRSDPSLQVNR